MPTASFALSVPQAGQMWGTGQGPLPTLPMPSASPSREEGVEGSSGGRSPEVNVANLAVEFRDLLPCETSASGGDSPVGF
jgi:hypothetical protein